MSLQSMEYEKNVPFLLQNIASMFAILYHFRKAGQGNHRKPAVLRS
jgi:hypothetical protein